MADMTSMTTDRLLHQLPESLKNMVALTDIETTLLLVRQFGGTNFHIPPLRMMHPNHALALLIGLDHAMRICRYYSGDSIYLPRASHYLQAIRDEQIRADAAQMTNAALALKYGMSERWVRQIKRGRVHDSLPDDRQMGLF